MREDKYLYEESASLGKEEFPKPPNDLRGLLKWLRKMNEEENRLQFIEKKFIVTRDSIPLKEFIPPSDKFRKCRIIEKIEEPIGLFCPMGNNWPPERLKQTHEDVKRMFPNTKIYEITFADGKNGFAYIGMDTHILACVIELGEKERAIHKTIEQQSAKLISKQNGGQNNDGDNTGIPTPCNFLSGSSKPKGRKI